MATLAIDKDFLLDFGRLDRPLQDKVAGVFEKFESATHAGVHLEKISNARNPRFRSIRIDKFWRGIVLAPESGQTYTLLKVLPHDDAYTWAQRRDISVNRATGGIEIRDEVALTEALPAVNAAAEQTAQRLFAHLRDSDLERLGIDDRTLGFARALTTVEALEAAQEFLPSTQWQVLYGLAAGMTPEEVWADMGADLISESIDANDLDAAIARSTSRILLVDGPDELMAVFANPFALWRVYLHPAQQSIVDAVYSGPARVTGGPGTGKTVVALHRAKRLAERGDGKVLVTTFTSTLAESLEDGILMLVDEPAHASRIVVQHIDRIAHRVFRDKNGAPRLLNADDEAALWREAHAAHPTPFTETFLAEEWRQVVLAHQLTTETDYLAGSRRGRGRGLSSGQKQQVWAAIEAFEQLLTTRSLWTHETIRREATRILQASPDKLYRHIVVDEAQDLSPDQWRLLRAATVEQPDDLFIAGDVHQRIYNNRVSLRDVGINIAGRSRRLAINYRTTAEILGWSLSLIHDEHIDDMNGGLDTLAGCRSEVRGDPPEVIGFDTEAAELDQIADKVCSWIAQGVVADEIGVATRTKQFGERVERRLRASKIPTHYLAKGTTSPGAVSIGTMHRMKGLEFRCLVVAGVNSDSVPAPAAVTPIDEDSHTHRLDLLRERSLLFVACTRAREQLLVTWHGKPSSFLRREGR
ncbi:UvrD-helicase domain-containing protein [Nocardia cyriacigeorgica]|uniref:UvrD-helicase domain-containing protein n=1 Tax=Nocardia cyriacigeorgica TaxID=135487 RepID=UPI002457EE25|nr:UvrD-helicase domain-containing protein [Nocardia cyriacigeorgica]